MVAAAILDNFEWPMATSPQGLTMYLYSAHRAVIFCDSTAFLLKLKFNSLTCVAGALGAIDAYTMRDLE